MENLIIKQYLVRKLEKMLNPDNPRWMPESEMHSLRTSLDEFGCVEPIVVNLATNQVVGGHQRIKAAIAQGIEYLPVVEIEIEEKRELAFNLGLNRIGGEWDYEKLGKVLKELPDFELQLTGFQQSEIDLIISEQEKNQSKIEDEIDRENELENDEDFVEDEDENEDDDFATEGKTKENNKQIKIKFGQFEKVIDEENYHRWLESLIIATGNSSPVSLAKAIASKLNLSIKN
jgi:hypothetical protein